MMPERAFDSSQLGSASQEDTHSLEECWRRERTHGRSGRLCQEQLCRNRGCQDVQRGEPSMPVLAGVTDSRHFMGRRRWSRVTSKRSQRVWTLSGRPPMCRWRRNEPSFEQSTRIMVLVRCVCPEGHPLDTTSQLSRLFQGEN